MKEERDTLVCSESSFDNVGDLNIIIVIIKQLGEINFHWLAVLRVLSNSKQMRKSK